VSKQTHFTFKAGDHLDRDAVPAIAGRAFKLTAKFDTRSTQSGVLLAQGGSAHGYALYLADGKLHFTVRSRAGATTVSTSEKVTGAHTATARLEYSGSITLQMDDQPASMATARGLITVQPADGLDVGSDEGGAVGPYKTPNKFTGTIEVITLELDPK
jgi:hypothetical protein